jgi:thioesterase domain-containing protein
LPADMPLAIVPQQAALVECHLALLRAHTVTPLQAPLYIWWSRTSLQEGRSPSQWQRYALGGMHVETLACNHFNMMQPPYVQVLARQLHTCLQAVQGKPLPAT